ncbi:hypothetical protein [Streptomyces anulatus]|jgi:hypothetical protein|uniref:PIN domain nuclease n=1 Tax=Streptomyces anulatus TaxID=1892 RepID=A0ABZ1Z7H3_STRAQ|nr:hypothetical protein [Streptomyces anulatus]
MGHYPWLRIADCAVIAGTDDLLALFTEAERQHLPRPWWREAIG